MKPSCSSSLRFAYNTNGFAFHDLDAIVEILAGLGYDGLALTLDHHHMDPRGDDAIDRAADLRVRLEEAGLAVAVETGARYLLDPRRKHEPSLASPDPDGRRRRVESLCRCIEVAAILGAEVVTAFAGRVDGVGDASREEALDRVAEGLGPCLDAADRAGVSLTLEPEPGHLVETLSELDQLKQRVGGVAGERLGLTLDLGHVLVSEPEEVRPPDAIRARSAMLRHVHIEDALRSEHVHLPFGEGELDSEAALAALIDVDFRGLVAVELSRHSHEAPLQARLSIEHLRKAEANARSSTASG